MQITDVDTYTLKRPMERAVGDSRIDMTDVYLVVVELTAGDHTGVGWMASLGFAPDVMERLVESQFAEILLGRDPLEIEALRRDMRLQTVYYGETGIAAWPRGAIDVALWDLKGKVADVPLYRLLGGSEDSVRAYASSMDATHDREELADLHGGYADQGFTAFKTKVGDKAPEEEAARVGTVRDAVGPDADLFVDANQAWTVSEAIRTVEVIDDHRIDWIEEPISEFEHERYGRVTDSVRPPVATGEMLYRPEQFRWLIEERGVDIVQPDLIRSGGVTGAMDVARLAAMNDLPVAPHFYYVVSAHVASAAPTGFIVEYIPEFDVAPLLDPAPVVEDGRIHLPDRPGHGYAIDPAARDEYLVTFD